MTETSTPPYLAQLELSLPGRSDSATISVTLMPDDTIPVKGERKALADCTLRELRAFANTLEAEVWETYDEISLLDMTSAKEVAVMLARLDKNGQVADQMDDWASSIVLLPIPASAVGTQPAKPATATDAPQPRATANTAKAAEAKVVGSTGLEAEAEKGSIPTTKPTPKTTASKAEPKAESKAVVEKAPEPAEKPAVKKDLDDVAAAIAFPAPVSQKDIEEARPKTAEKPHMPATIQPSEARVRVAGKRLPLGGAASAAVDILMDEPALRAMQAHALSSLDREVAGVMVGPRPEKQPDGRYLVRVIDSISAKYTVMQGASVTYTADSWRYLNDTLEERYPDETGVMIGWYHTHPGFGIFLSGMDLFIHQNFFTQIWHTAYVLDPRARTSGFFCWSRDKSRVNKYDFGWPDWAEGSW